MKRILEGVAAIVITIYTYFWCWDFVMDISYEYSIYRGILWWVLVFAIIPLAASLWIYVNIISYHLIDFTNGIKLLGERLKSILSSFIMARIVFAISIVVFIVLFLLGGR